MKNIYAFIFCMLVVVSSNGQTVFNLNDTSLTFPQELSEAQRQANSWFDDGVRVRPFFLNSQIRNHQNLQAGDEIVLQLFNDVTHPATVLRKATDINGVTAVTLKLNGYQYAYAYIALSPDSYLVTVDIPEENQKYSSRSNIIESQSYMFQLDETQFQNLKCGLDDEAHSHENNDAPQIPEGIEPLPGAPIDGPAPEPMNTGCHTMPDINDPAIIRILIAYTPAAVSWVNSNTSENINDVIATTMAQLNQVSENNNLGITFQMAHSALVNYTEVTMGTDNRNLSTEGNGFLDEVHTLRKDFDADLVALLNYKPEVLDEDGNPITQAAGIANLLNSKYGNNRAVFSTTQVHFALNSTTFIHEIGHNMGADHNRYQSSAPGPNNWENWQENTWTAGWRWQGSNNNYYADLMSYPGAVYGDPFFTTLIPYFSDPNHTHLGGIAGDPELGDNARMLREIKHYVARYKETNTYCSAGNAPLYGITSLYINNVTMGDINNPSGASTARYGDFTALATCMVQGDSQTLDISITNSGNNSRVKVWIDWNDDKIFDPVTELVYSSGAGGAQHNVTITSPLGVSLGDKRMRIRTYDTTLPPVVDTPCGFSSIGEVEDYTIRLEAAPPCTVAEVPGNLLVGDVTANSASLTWDSQLGIDHYELRYREVGAPDWTEIGPIWYPYYTLTDLNFDADYEAQVRTVCNNAPSAYTSTVEFTTTGYCPATYSGGLTITRVRIGEIDNVSSGGSGYSDFTNIATDLERGRTYNIKVNNNTGGNYEMAYAAYIDYNFNGSFEVPAELIWNQTSVLGTEVSGQFTVPMDASLESARLRVLMIYTTNTNTIPQPCTVSGSSGEVEDYTVNIIPYAPCAVASAPVNFTVSNITDSQATLSWDEVPGADYDVRYRETAATEWLEVNGFFENSLALQNLINDAEYEAQVRSVCDGTPGTYSAPLVFTTNKYCNSQGGNNWNITNVTFSDINNNSSAGNPSDSYTDFTNIIGTVNQSFSYDLTITSTGGIENVKSYRVWIDYNQDGIFDASELVLDQQTASATVSENVTIPGDVLLGNTRMRVSYKLSSLGQDPCESFGFGEVEDYTINVLEFVPCETAAVPDNFTLMTVSDTEATLGWDVQSGAAFELRYREMGAPDWIDETETFTNSITLESLTPATLYEAQVRSKCDELTVSDYTSSLEFETNSTPLTYCDAGATNTGFEKISNVTFNTINNNSTSSVGYEDFTHISTEVEQGATYPFSASFNGTSYPTDQVLVWIDFNQNGDFTDPGEQVLITPTSTSPWLGDISIPSNALEGPTRMRVRLHDTGDGPNATPCGNSTYGQVEDYTVIVTSVVCEEAIVPDNFQLDDIAQNDATLIWDAIPGATYEVRYRETGSTEWNEMPDLFTSTVTLQPLEAATEYEAQLRSVCDGDFSVYTNSLIFTTLEYCASSGGSTINILNVTFGDINQSSPGGTTESSYTDFTNVSTSVIQGESYTISINSPGPPIGKYFRVWIDYNQNGSFEDSGELVLDVQNTTLETVTGTVVIPPGVDIGATRMRVSVKMYAPPQGPCDNFDFGEVEDYTVIITTPGYVYENGNWTPENPVGVSTLNDDIYIMNGTTALSGDLLANNLLISEGATLNTAHAITLNGDIDNDGLLLFHSNGTSTGQLDTFTGSITGSGLVTVERYIPARRAFRFLSSAVNTTSTINANWQEGAVNATDNPNAGFGTHITGSVTGENGFDATPSGNPSLFTLNNTGQTWEAVGNTDLNTIAAGTAYRMLVRGDRSIDVTSNSAIPTNTTLRTTGTLHTGSFIVSDLSESENAFNFIGNPYPAAVNMNEVLNGSTNLNTIHYWVWDPTLGGTPIPGQPGGRGAYVAVNVGDNTSNNPSSQANRYLQPGQAAFVQTMSNGSAAMTFQEQHKAVDQPQTQVFSITSTVRLNLYDANSFATGTTASDGLLIKFSESGNNELTLEDAMKFYNQDENLASVNNETLLSIESRALPLVGETIPLFTNQYRKTNYMFEASLLEMNEILVFLKDHYTGTLTELFNNENTLYPFQVDPAIAESMADDRFEIVFEEMLSTDEVSFGDGFVLFPNPTNGSFNIATRHIQGDMVNITLSSITGQKVYSNTLTVPSNGQLVIEVPGLASGLYMVELMHPQGGLFTSKLVKN